MSGRIVIVGGYGAFGAHVAERLAREPGIEVVVAGRSSQKASAHAQRLAHTAKATISHAVLDATTASTADIKTLNARVIVNASGPFQAQDYKLAQACIDADCHYLDLADARAFVTGITRLDKAARAASVCVISGASSVPGLSSAVVQNFANTFQSLDTVEIGICPGNSFDPGEATTASILSHVGKPFAMKIEGRDVVAYGWQGLRRHHFPMIGARWICDVNVPDLDLLPAHYATLRTARFSAGVEVGIFHLGLWTLSWLVRAGITRSLASLARPLLYAKRHLRFLGTDRGGMFVTIRGCDKGGAERALVWHLIARSGHGSYVPAIATVILAKRLIAGKGPPVGATPCFGHFTLAEFEAEVADLDIACASVWQ